MSENEPTFQELLNDYSRDIELNPLVVEQTI